MGMTATIDSVAAMDVWERTVPRIQAHLSGQTFDTWFGSLAALEFDGRTLLLEVPSPFYVDWLDQHYRGLIEQSVSAAIGTPVGVSFQPRNNGETAAEDPPAIHSGYGAPMPPAALSRDESHLVPLNTF